MKSKYSVKDVSLAVKNKISSNIDYCIKELDEGTQKIKDFMTLHQIEQCITKLNNDNSRSCLDLVNFYLNNLDEKDLIEAKKKSCWKKM